MTDNINKKEHLSTAEVEEIIKANGWDTERGLNHYSLYLIFVGMGVKSIDGIPLCPTFFEESNFLKTENSISFEEGRFASGVLSHVISSPMIQPHNAKKLQAVVNALERLIADNNPITKAEY